jgi:hypothetical protein
MKKDRVEHVVFRYSDGKLFCEHCKATADNPPMPVLIDDFVKYINAFVTVHKDCKPK